MKSLFSIYKKKNATSLYRCLLTIEIIYEGKRKLIQKRLQFGKSFLDNSNFVPFEFTLTSAKKHLTEVSCKDFQKWGILFHLIMQVSLPLLSINGLDIHDYN